MQSRHLTVCLTGALLTAAMLMTDPAAASAKHMPVVTTTDGAVRGVVTDGVAAYLGIPYAKPPVGPLRWRAPEAPGSWKGVRDASHFGANCYQGPGIAFGPYTAEFMISGPVSESCLFLNVWTPERRSGELPVYVFIHGGGFNSGSGSIPIYNGTHLADKGVVVVTINYRLGVFGFLALPELTKESRTGSSGNYGMEDIIAALKWVHANIARFGGNPQRVTVSGQSAGAAAVNFLLVSKPAKGLFERALAESGSGMGIFTPTLQQAERIGLDFERRAGASSLSELRAESAAKLMRASYVAPPKKGPSAGLPPIVFAPNVDGSVVAVDPTSGALLQSNVPLLTGFNYDEGQLWGKEKVTPEQFEVLVRKQFGKFAGRILAVYPHASLQEATDSAATLARDRYMASLLIFSDERAASSGEPVFDYLFDHAYPVPDAAKWGSFHTAEVPYVFGALKQKGRVFTAKDHEISTQLQRYWINFMRTGNPNGPGVARWPRAGRMQTQVMGLGNRVGARPAVSTPERLRVLRDFVAHGGKLSLF